MNTKVSYLYRDAYNYKQFNDVIVEGTLRLDEISIYLNDEEYFIPSEVGLENLQPEVWEEEDHIWHEIESLDPTEEAPTLKDITAKQFLEKFKVAHKNNWFQHEDRNHKGTFVPLHVLWGIKDPEKREDN